MTDNKLVRYGSGPDRLAKYRGPDGKIDLARVNERLNLARPVAEPSTGKPGEVADLPRICAVHDKPYAARYVRGNDGRFRHAQCIKVTESLYLGQYANNTGQRPPTVNDEDMSEETCPWCGAAGWGPVLCGDCDREICYGKTTGRHFRCRASCSGEGTMVSDSRTQQGYAPRLAQGGFWVPGGRR